MSHVLVILGKNTSTVMDGKKPALNNKLPDRKRTIKQSVMSLCKK